MLEHTNPLNKYCSKLTKWIAGLSRFPMDASEEKNISSQIYAQRHNTLSNSDYGPF